MTHRCSGGGGRQHIRLHTGCGPCRGLFIAPMRVVVRVVVWQAIARRHKDAVRENGIDQRFNGWLVRTSRAFRCCAAGCGRVRRGTRTPSALPRQPQHEVVDLCEARSNEPVALWGVCKHAHERVQHRQQKVQTVHAVDEAKLFQQRPRAVCNRGRIVPLSSGGCGIAAAAAAAAAVAAAHPATSGVLRCRHSSSSIDSGGMRSR